MQKSKIEWTDYTVNPVKGYCPMACPYCYARRMYDRFKWDKRVRWQKGVIGQVANIKTPSRIFVGSTIELFGDWIKPDWLRQLFTLAEMCPQHTFIFLTKQPQNLQKWSPFPANCWVGVSVTDGRQFAPALEGLMAIKASVRFISFEPLQKRFLATMAVDVPGEDDCFGIQDLDWLIIGAETGNRKGKPPLTEVHKWAKEIIAAADEAGIPVFLKDNLKWPTVRREWPK